MRARVRARDAEWLVRRVEPNHPGNILEVRGISGIVKGKEAYFIDLLEPTLEVVDPAAVNLVVDHSPGFYHTKLHLESAFRISAPTGRTPTVVGKAAIDDLIFQHEPVKRALAQPRVRLLIADDVGLGKTLEAGLVTAELLVRRKADRILVVTTKTMLAQFQREFWSRFSIPLVRLDSAAIRRARNAIPTNHNPFNQFDKAIISVDTLKNDGQYRTALENAYWDLIIIDEAHNVAARRATSGSRSLRATVARLLADRADSLLLLTATPHDGSARSFNSLIQMLDPTAVADPDEVSRGEVSQFLVRRFRTTPDVQAELKSKIPPREVRRIEFDLTPAEDKAYQSVAELELDADVEARAQGRRSGNELFRTTIAKALFSSPAACIETIDNRLRRIKQGEVAGTARDAERLRSLRDDIVAVGNDDFTKYQNLRAHLNNLKWTGKDKRDRLLIFSERIASLRWLEKRLQSDYPKLADKGIVVLDGSGVGSDVRAQEIVEEFENENSPIRILLASDMASEGLNLHFQCHRLFHFDLPWALLTFQQRNGRIDRYGQDRQPIISYFVGCSTHPKVNDMWVLDVLVEKDEAAQHGIGDPSVFFGTNDAVEQEAILTDGLQRGIGSKVLSKELDVRAAAAATSPARRLP
jgi:SNF2 family DNA or RNA helicase